MSTTPTPEALQAEVAEHKRLARYHRRQARVKATTLAQLRDELARRGVGLVLEGEATQEGPHGHDTTGGAAGA